ncbi:MAG TPA: phosphopantetheine-binding protein, partial [Mycobacterium sp.]
FHRVIDAFADDADQTLRDIAITEAEERRRLVEDWSRTAVAPAGLPQTEGATHVYVLDEWLEPAAVGVTGNVHYAGGAVDGASRNSHGISASRFGPNPFDTDPQARLYRTGDRARWTVDGRLELVVSGDHRLQGALEAIDGVAAALTRNWEGRSGTILAGYVVPAHTVDDPAAFVDAVRAALPAELVPASITVVADLEPGSLPRPTVTSTGPSEPPSTDTERTLAAMLVDLLSAPVVGRHDDIFTLGGDSILAVQLAARARDAGVALTARMVFEHPELAELAAAVDAAGGQVAQQDTHLAPMAVSGLSADELASLAAGWSAQDPAP